MGSPDFFAVEAAEYLDQLSVLASRADGTAADRFASLSRALRGSALMANQEPIGTAAAALEHLGLSVKNGRIPWDHRIRGLAARTVDDIKRLIRKISAWSTAETAMVEAIVAELDSVTGQSSAMVETAIRPGIESGLMAFAAGQGSALAQALEEIADALESGEPATDCVDRVRGLQRPLAGLAALTDMPPLPEILDGLDRVIGMEAEGDDLSAGHAPLLRAAGQALHAATAQLAESGAADPDAPEARDFAEQLDAFFDTESDVVDIQTLLYDEEIEARDTQLDSVQDDLAELELVSLGEHLQHAADELADATSITQRDFRARALERWLGSLGRVTRGPLQIALSEFAEAACHAIAHGRALHHPDDMVGHLRDAGLALSTGPTDQEYMASRLFAVATDLRADPPPPPTPVEEVETPAPVVTEPETAEPEPISIVELCYSGPPAVERALGLRTEILSAMADPTHDRRHLTELIEEAFDLVELGLEQKT